VFQQRRGGIMTAPSLMAASMVSHSGTQFGSMISSRSPARSPSEARKFATCAERCASSENVSDDPRPRSSTTRNAGSALPAATTSK